MKVAIFCDKILKRDYTVKVLEAFLQIYPQAQIYTLAHQNQGIRGTLGRKKIYSSYLSHFVKDERDFWRWSCLIPNATRAATPNSAPPFDLTLCLSGGLGLSLPPSLAPVQVSYLLGWDLFERWPRSWGEKIFKALIHHHSLIHYARAQQLWTISEPLKERVSHALKESAPPIEVLSPFFSLGDYPLFPPGQRAALGGDYYVVEGEVFNLKQARKLMEISKAQNLKFIFVGEDSHLTPLKAANPKLFWGERCAGETAPFLAGAKAYINLCPVTFPERALASLAVGCPLVLGLPKSWEGVFQKGVFWSEKIEDLTGALRKCESERGGLKPQELRASVQKFNLHRFKTQFQGKLEKKLSNHLSGV